MIYFLSDTHFQYHNFSVEERKKVTSFLHFLDHIRGAGRLYLVGDIFDFWFEYGAVVPRYYHDILTGLHDLSRSGTEILITGGNHDFWIGPYLTESIGMTRLSPLVTHELQGRRITITHGDLLLPGDYAYKALKAVIRSWPAVALARIVHPDILYGFARLFSRASKSIPHGKADRSKDILVRMAPESFFRWGNDAFIMGHIHYPCIERFDGREFVILGDWEEHRSFVRLEDGVLSLESYSPVE
jgi:UDP-2,3-diacylglucosamine hydrolase